MTKERRSAWVYVANAGAEVILWLVLYFCFKHDYQREDFVFIPIQATWVMAIIFGITLIRIIKQCLIKFNK